MIQPKRDTSSLPASFDITKTTPETCEKCGSEAFVQALMMRRVSALLTDTGKEGFIPVQVFSCAACGHVNTRFIPEELRVKIEPVRG